jgi:metallophosphoesterase (TIGR00282 family)
LKDEYKPDLVIANVENLAHGKGVTIPTLRELSDLGVEVFTSGNHVFDKVPQSEQAFSEFPNLIRPTNYAEQYPGVGFYRFSKNGQHYLIINLNGGVFFEKQFRGTIQNPFFALDSLLTQESQKDDIILVDFHAEATSEKVAMGWYADGRVAGVFGTHTHIPTADARILPQGTGYVTDAGMTGPANSVIGAKTQNALATFLEQDRFRMEPEEEGPAVVNAVFLETENTKAIKIEKIQRYI